MSYIINNSRGNIVAVVPDGTTNNTATSLSLVGQGVTNYGTAQNENFVYLLENFAAPSSPFQPTLGQLWYKSDEDQLYSYSSANSWVLVANEVYVQAQKISPVFTGIPTAPTAAAGTATAQIATTAFVTNSPQFSGTPRAPTAANGTVSTQLATTAFVQNTFANQGTMSQQNANAVNITGGTISGLTAPIPIGSGGTGAQFAADARINLGLGNLSVQSASNVAITGGNVQNISTLQLLNSTTGAVISTGGVLSPVTALPISAGGTGSTTAAGARTNLGLGSGATANIGTMGLQNANAVSITGGQIISLNQPVPVNSGGTGGQDAANARLNLEAAKSGQNSDITRLTGLTTPLGVVFGGTGVGSHTAGAVLIGAGTGNLVSVSPGNTGNVLISNGSSWLSSAISSGGNVSSVGILAGTGMSVTGSPITGSGNITVTNTGITSITTTSGNAMTGAITIAGAAVVRSGNTITINAGGGTVTSVSVAAGTGISVTGSPISTTGTVTVTNTGITQIVTDSGSPITGSVTITGNAVTRTGNTLTITTGGGGGGGGDVYKANNQTFTGINTFNNTTNTGALNVSGALAVSSSATLTGNTILNRPVGFPTNEHVGFFQVGPEALYGFSRGTWPVTGAKGMSIWYGSMGQGTFFSDTFVGIGTAEAYCNGRFTAEHPANPNIGPALLGSNTGTTGGAGVIGRYVQGTPGLGVGVIGFGTSTAFGGDCIQAQSSRSSTSAYDFLECYAAGGTRARITGEGRFQSALGAAGFGGFDYAEYFESHDGTQLEAGTSVVLEDDKIRAATDQDDAADIIGVVRPKEPGTTVSIIGNEAEIDWAHRYLTDEFGRYVVDTHYIIDWEEKPPQGETKFFSYESHAIPDHVTVPDHAKIRTHDDQGKPFTHWRENPDYDANATYVPRSQRDEWNIIGLIGQVQVLKGQPVNPRWRKMKTVGSNVDMWFIR